MKIPKAIVINVVLYGATFVLAIAINTLKGTPLKWDAVPVGPQVFVAMVTGIVLTSIGVWWFFRAEPASGKRGLMFGVIAILTGFALDGVVSIGIWSSGQNPLGFLQTSFSFWFFGFMLVIVLVATSVVGWVMSRRRTG